MKKYPAWRYHRYHEPVIVQTQEEGESLGPEWADTPAAFYPVPEQPEPEAAPIPEPAAAPMKKLRK